MPRACINNMYDTRVKINSPIEMVCKKYFEHNFVLLFCMSLWRSLLEILCRQVLGGRLASCRWPA